MYLTDQGLEEIEQYASEKKNANILLAIQVLKEIRKLNARADELEKRVQSQPLEIIGALQESANKVVDSIYNQELQYMREKAESQAVATFATDREIYRGGEKGVRIEETLGRCRKESS